MDPSSSSPVAVVTGASGRLGSAIAGSLARRGACLVLVDIAEPALASLVERLGPAVPVKTAAVDVSAAGAAADVVACAVAAYGRLDAVINAAGIEGPIGRIETIGLDAVRRVYEVNVFGLLAMSQAAIRQMRAQRSGRIINIASGAGLAGSGFMATYSSSKHAVVGLTRSIAQEVADDGIVVNAVCPGCVDSPMMGRIEAALSDLSGGPVSYADSIPLRRYADPTEVGELVAYLAVDAPVYVTGTAVVIDGGMRS